MTLFDLRDSITERDKIVSIVKGMLVALKELHGAGYVHGDVCAANFMFTKNDEVILIDFGRVKPRTPEQTDEDLRDLGRLVYSLLQLEDKPERLGSFLHRNSQFQKDVDPRLIDFLEATQSEGMTIERLMSLPLLEDKYRWPMVFS